MLLCDGELQQICAAYDKMNLTEVKSLREHYESDTVEKMKNVEYFVEEKFIGKDLQDLPLPSVLGLYSKDKIYEFYLQ